MRSNSKKDTNKTDYKPRNPDNNINININFNMKHQRDKGFTGKKINNFMEVPIKKYLDYKPQVERDIPVINETLPIKCLDLNNTQKNRRKEVFIKK